MNSKRMQLLESAVEESKLDLEEPEEVPADEGGRNDDEDELLQLAMTGEEGNGVDANYRRAEEHVELENNDDEMLELIAEGPHDEPAELQDDDLLDLLFEN
jgi:hypothetical protein